MSKLKLTLVLMAIVVAFGVVGRMDYEDAKASEGRISEVHRVGYPLMPTIGRAASMSKRRAERPGSEAGFDLVEPLTRAVFHCVPLDES